MKKLLGVVAVLSLTTATVQATSLNVSVQTAAGASSVDVQPGDPVNYRVTGILSDDLHEGLALVGFDLVFDGGDLAQASTPAGALSCGNPMVAFVKPDGITNPAGYGGTVIGGDLIQVGGGQNTIKNTADNADFPIGTVLTGVAQPAGCGTAVLVTGTLTAPGAEGTYHLNLQNLFANVIRDGETGEPFWATEAAGVGTISNLTINVATPTECVLTLTNLPACPIDAGYPFDPNVPATLFGWDAVDVSVSGTCTAQGLGSGDFTVSTTPALPAPTISSVTDDGGSVATLHLSGPISPGGWTCFTHTASGSKVCLGFLPADVAGDRSANAADVLDLIDDLNNVRVPPLEDYQCDVDRSGVCNPADVLAVIDLLNGAGAFTVWNNIGIPACPIP